MCVAFLNARQEDKHQPGRRVTPDPQQHSCMSCGVCLAAPQTGLSRGHSLAELGWGNQQKSNFRDLELPIRGKRENEIAIKTLVCVVYLEESMEKLSFRSSENMLV